MGINNFNPNYPYFFPTLTREDGETSLSLAANSYGLGFNPIISGHHYGGSLNGLYTYDFDYNVVPQLAASDPILSEDQLTWIIQLRDDVFWHDGEQFDASDVYFSFMAYDNPDNPQLYGLGGDTESNNMNIWWEDLGNITILDPFTIQFEMSEIYPSFTTRGLMANIIPEHLLNVSDTNVDGFISDESAWQNFSKGINHVGTGSYYLVADLENEQFSYFLRNNENNSIWPGDVLDSSNSPFDYSWTELDSYQINNITYKVFENISDQISDFEENKLDIIPLPYTPDLISTYEINPQLNVTSAPSYSYDLLIFNFEDPIFKDDPVKAKFIRKAIAHAINRDYLIEVFREGHAVTCDNPIPPSNSYYYNENNPVKYPFDIETAIEYMELAGYDVIVKPPTITVDPTDTDPTDTDPTTHLLSGLRLNLTLMIFSIILVINRKRKK